VKERNGKPATRRSRDLRTDPDPLAEIPGRVDDANKAVSRAESIRRFRVLDRDFTQDDGHPQREAEPQRPGRRQDFAADIEALYSERQSRLA